MNVETAEWVKDAPTCGEVRYFHNDDEVRARKLAEALEQHLKTLGFHLHMSVLDLSRSRLAKSVAGTLEFWLPPLHSLAHVNGVPATNPADGAALSLVSGSCASLGSTPEQRRRLASDLGAPYNIYFDQELPRQKVWRDGFLM